MDPSSIPLKPKTFRSKLSAFLSFFSAGKHGTGLYHHHSLFQSSPLGGLLTIGFIIGLIGIATKLFIDASERRNVQTLIKREVITLSEH